MCYDSLVQFFHDNYIFGNIKQGSRNNTILPEAVFHSYSVMFSKNWQSSNEDNHIRVSF